MAELSQYPVQVYFDVNNLADPIRIESSFFLPGTKDLPIPQGISLIVLQLIPVNTVVGGPQPQFPTYPIEWFEWLDDGITTRAMPQPEWFQVQRFNEIRCTIVDFNTALRNENNRHPFNVVVAYNNKTYGSDPTIVNEPEDG